MTLFSLRFKGEDLIKFKNSNMNIPRVFNITFKRAPLRLKSLKSLKIKIIQKSSEALEMKDIGLG
jgi:hypothetical protein